MIGEIQRLPHEAELALSNAIAHMSEAATVLRQHAPDGQFAALQPVSHAKRKPR